MHTHNHNKTCLKTDTYFNRFLTNLLIVYKTKQTSTTTFVDCHNSMLKLLIILQLLLERQSWKEKEYILRYAPKRM